MRPGRLLLRVALAGAFVIFCLLIVAEIAGAQTRTTNPWDRPDEPLDEAAGQPQDEPATESAPGLCNPGLGLPASIACRAATAAGGAVLGEAAGAAASSALDGLVGAIADGAVWFLSKVAAVLDSTTRPDLRSSWFAGRYDTMVALAGLVVLPLVLVAIIDAVVHARPGEVVRCLLVYLPLAGIATYIALQLVDTALFVTDWASAYVSGDIGGDTAGFLEGMGRVLSGAGGGELPLFALFVGGLFTLFGAFVLWVELILRNAGIHLAALFLPLAFATMVWPRIARWASRALRTLAALILSKFFIVAILSLGASMLATVGRTGGRAPTVTAGMAGGTGAASGSLEAVIAGAAVLALATFAPWVLWRLLAPVEGAMDSVLEGAARRPTAATDHPHLSQISRVGSRVGGGSGGRGLPVVGTTSQAAGGAASSPGGGAAGANAGGTAGAVGLAAGTATAATNQGKRKSAEQTAAVTGNQDGNQTAKPAADRGNTSTPAPARPTASPGDAPSEPAKTAEPQRTTAPASPSTGPRPAAVPPPPPTSPPPPGTAAPDRHATVPPPPADRASTPARRPAESPPSPPATRPSRTPPPPPRRS